MNTPPLTLLACFNFWSLTIQHQKDSLRSRQRAAYIIGALKSHGLTFPGEVTYAGVSGVIEMWQTHPVNPLTGATINRYLSALSGVMTEAVKRGEIATVPLLPWQNEGGGRKDYLSRADWESLRGGLSEKAHTYAVLAEFLLMSGMRLGEALRLRYEDIVPDTEDPAYTVFILRDTKNGTQRMVPVPTVSLPAPFGSGLLFPGHGTCSGAALKRAFQREFKAVVDRLWPERILVPHSLRHTCASWMVAAGVPLNTVGEYLGHKNLQTTTRYAHHATKALVGALAAMRGTK